MSSFQNVWLLCLLSTDVSLALPQCFPAMTKAISNEETELKKIRRENGAGAGHHGQKI
jgi:hypothetical protein